MKKVMDEYMAFSKKREYIVRKKEEAMKLRDRPSSMSGEVCIIGVIHPMVTVDLYSIGKDIQTAAKQQRYYVKDGEFHSEIYSEGSEQ